MNENVRKVFEMLGVEPNERFKVEDCNGTYYINERLFVNKNDGVMSDIALRCLLTGEFNIIKLPKEQKQKKKLRYLTPEDYKKMWDTICRNTTCRECMFNNVPCEANSKECWVNHKDLYSDKFLDQEIEVE